MENEHVLTFNGRGQLQAGEERGVAEKVSEMRRADV
jgi:hypothetical protein